MKPSGTKVLRYRNKRNGVKSWYIAIAKNRYRGRFALIMNKSEDYMREMYRNWLFIEYRKCTGAIEVVKLAWVYNHGYPGWKG